MQKIYVFTDSMTKCMVILMKYSFILLKLVSVLFSLVQLTIAPNAEQTCNPE